MTWPACQVGDPSPVPIGMPFVGSFGRRHSAHHFPLGMIGRQFFLDAVKLGRMWSYRQGLTECLNPSATDLEEFLLGCCPRLNRPMLQDEHQHSAASNERCSTYLSRLSPGSEDVRRLQRLRGHRNGSGHVLSTPSASAREQTHHTSWLGLSVPVIHAFDWMPPHAHSLIQCEVRSLPKSRQRLREVESRVT